MKWLVAFVITLGLLALFCIASALAGLYLIWILIGITSLWAAFDSKRLGLARYKTGIRCQPVVLFCLCYLLWIFIFPWYLWARFKIKSGEVELFDETANQRSWRQFEKVAHGLLIAITVFKLLLLGWLIEENQRGQRILAQYKQELEAKGQILDWAALTPPPVPDDQNIFRAPKMSEWFIHPNKKIALTDDLNQRMNDTNVSHSLMIAAVCVLPPPAGTTNLPNNFDAAFRYIPDGSALFTPGSMEYAPNQPAVSSDSPIPLIEFIDVPITTAIENLARQADINYILDPKIGYNDVGADGKIVPEPQLTLRWENIRCQDALIAVLNGNGLVLTNGPKPGISLITKKPEDAPKAWLSPDIRAEWDRLFASAVGANLAGSRGITLTARPLNQIKPALLAFYTEQIPTPDTLEEWFKDVFADKTTAVHANYFQAEKIGTNLFRISIRNTATATDYLEWSDRFKSDFDLMREALKRPYARMDGDYSNPPYFPYPYYVAIRCVSQTLAQRAQCDLLLGRPDQALKELTLLNDLRRILEGAPTGKPMTLVSAMINVAVAGLYTDVVAEGFRRHAWQLAQLETLQRQLESINLEPDVKEAFECEQAMLWAVTKKAGINQIGINQTGGKVGPPTTFWQKLRAIARPNFMWGFLDLNIYNAIKLEQEAVDSYDTDNLTVRMDKITELQKKVEALGKMNRWQILPYNLLAVIAIPNSSKAGSMFAYHQTMANEGQIVCALERYRLANGKYPEKLEDLTPQFMAKVPHDIIGGKPLIYRASGTQFTLYSVGWNGTDDGGQFTDDTKLELGDWGWR